MDNDFESRWTICLRRTLNKNSKDRGVDVDLDEPKKGGRNVRWVVMVVVANEWTAGQAARKDWTMSKNEWKAQEKWPCSVLKV